MYWQQIALPVVASATIGAASTQLDWSSPEPFNPLASLRAKQAMDAAAAAAAAAAAPAGQLRSSRRADNSTGRSFLNDDTEKFALDGKGIPEVNFDIGESFAGLLPITDDKDDEEELYFWFFPSNNTASDREIVIWLNGGPGCSSLGGLMQENGPFTWKPGTKEPVANPWSWNELSNIVYIEQPVGTGFTQGTPTAKDEEDVAKQFMGFWKNFVKTFDLQDYKIYVTGESYAGMYAPYISSAMLDSNDTTYYDVAGLLIYDPSIAPVTLQQDMTIVPFTDYHNGLFPFNDTFRAEIHNRSASCGFDDYIDKYLTYPPPGKQPSLPLEPSNLACNQLFEEVVMGIAAINPCWDIYNVAELCPTRWTVLGDPNYTPKDAEIYFNRTDVQKAINAPSTTWLLCKPGVFGKHGDQSPPSSFTKIPSVIDRTKNVIIGHGALDAVLLANGTLLSIQNMTWGGQLGFQEPPTEPFYVPTNPINPLDNVAGHGVLGTTHSERGLTYVGIDVSGHMVPQYAPSVAFRHLEVLLGRVKDLTTVSGFTVDALSEPQTGIEDLGDGTAPPGFTNDADVDEKSGSKEKSDDDDDDDDNDSGDGDDVTPTGAGAVMSSSTSIVLLTALMGIIVSCTM